MRLLKKFFAKLKNPGLAVTICALAFFAAALTGVILAIVFNASPYIAYVMYFLSALGLAILFTSSYFFVSRQSRVFTRSPKNTCFWTNSCATIRSEPCFSRSDRSR